MKVNTISDGPRAVEPWRYTLDPLKSCFVAADGRDVAIKTIVVEPDDRFHGDLRLVVAGRHYWSAPVQHLMQAWRRLGQVKLNTDDPVEKWVAAMDELTRPITINPPALLGRRDIARVDYVTKTGVNKTDEGPALAVTLYGICARDIR